MNNLTGSKKVEELLNKAEENMQEAITLTIQQINSNSIKEKDAFQMWEKHATNLMDYFIRQAEKSGNEKLGKNAFKYAMFKRI